MGVLTMSDAHKEKKKPTELVMKERMYTDVQTPIDESFTKIDLSSNLLTNLRFLKGNHHVTSVKVSGNKIKNFEGFADVPNLHVLDVSDNPLESLEGVQEAENLNVLVVARCHQVGIPQSISAVSKLSHLSALVLREVSLANISLNPICHLSTLTKLSLSFCSLTKLPWDSKAHRLVNLQELRLSHNHITVLDNFLLACKLIRILDLGSNQLEEGCLKVIKQLPHLTNLTLKGNPFQESCSEEDYRESVLQSCRGKLKYLDGAFATKELEEKKQKKREIGELTRKPPKHQKLAFGEDEATPVKLSTAKREHFVLVDGPKISQVDEIEYQDTEDNTFVPSSLAHRSSQDIKDSGLARSRKRARGGKDRGEGGGEKLEGGSSHIEEKSTAALNFLMGTGVE